MSNRAHILSVIIICICVGTALFIEWKTTPSPSQKAIHVETFRYGTHPYIIRANRGDHLILTFSTHDTGHSFFLQDYSIDAKISPASEQVEVRDPFSIEAPPRRMKEVHLIAGLKGFWGRLVSLSRFRCHVYCGPMHGFEQGDLIVRPNWLFSGSLGLLAAFLLTGLVRALNSNAESVKSPETFVELNTPKNFLDRLLKWRPLQFIFTLPFLAGLVIVIMAGLLGTKVGGRNVAIMFTWIVCMSILTMVLVPLGGRIWCTICPLPVLGEYLQRRTTIQVRVRGKRSNRNRFFGLGLRWPMLLSNRWLQFALFMALGTFSASLAGQPRWTAITLILMVFAAIGMAMVWELRSFCRYVCPVAAYIAPFSLGARLALRKRHSNVCRKCKDRSCLNGNLNGWACPYGLCVPRITHNGDCGMCTECFKSCPYNNVSLKWRTGPWKGQFVSQGEAFQAIALTVMAAVYSLTVHSPWPGIRDMVNVVDKTDWAQFGLYAVVLWMLALGVVPLLYWLLTSLGLILIRKNEMTTGTAFKKTMPAILPLGVAMWAIFFIETLMSNFTFVVMTLSDPFGWGWDLLGTAGMPWIQIWPSGVPWIQAAFLLIGISLSLSSGYQRWLRISGDRTKALIGFLPAVCVYTAIATGMLAYITNF
jgi:polyferredoxin